MNVWKKAGTKRLVALLLTVFLAVGCLPWAGAESCFEGQACNQGLLPEDHHFKDGERINDGDGEIVLHKTAERIGPDEWNVTVRATINDEVQRPKQKLELVILMDTSGSMAWCTHQEEHDLGDHTTHNASCYRYSCGWENHNHTEACYVCNMEEHAHNDACYQLNCTQELHTHSVANGCYSICTNWQHYYCECQNIEGQRRILTCKNTHQSHSVSNGCYELACPKAEHTHSNKYNSTCEKELVCTLHVHTNDCEQELICTRQLIDHSTDGATFCKYAGTNQNLDSRLAVAKEKLLSLIENLKDTNKGYDVTVRFCSFSKDFTDHNNNQTITSIREKINGVSANGGTNMYTAIPSAIDKFQITDAKQVFLLMTDGEASDGGGNKENNAITKLNTFKNGGGTVFTVGFAYHNDDLAQIAGGGGSYVHAGSELELEKALLNIENIIHAMMVDPMGKKVGFDAGSIQLSESNVEGTVSYVGNTLYWNPTDGTVPGGAEIEYTYNVKLNSLADMEVGKHSRVELNDPTDLVYNITSNGTTTQYSVNFPIPEAEYQVATIKQRWVNQNGALKDDSEVESIISDYSDEEYTPQFVTDYQNPVKSITRYGYRYVYTGSTATKNGEEISLDAINPREADAYVVTHNYSYADNTKTVSYQYTGNVPADAPKASQYSHYAKPDSPVDVAENPTADGFSFSGWHAVSGITDSQISNGSFTMPNSNVVFEGSWTKLRGYRVQANYFVNINGLKTEQENLQVVDLGFITTTDESTSYDFSDAFAYDGKKYTTVTLAEGSVGTGITGNLVVGIEPGLDSTPVVTLNFYRNEDRSYTLFVKHVFDDGSTHEGYADKYEPYGNPYTYNQSWSVEGIAVPEGYARVMSTSGVTDGSNADTLIEQGEGVLKGDAFGNANKYVVIHYQKAPCYIVEADYYLVVDDEAPIKENVDAPVRLDFVTCETSDEHTYTIQLEDREYTVGDTKQSYTNAELKEGSDGTLNAERTAVSGINPATDTYPVVHLNFYRKVTTSVPYRVAHKYYTVAPDGTTRTEVIADALLISQNEDGTLLSGIHNETVGVVIGDVQPDIEVAPITQGQQTNDLYTLASVTTNPMTLDKTMSTDDNPQTITLEYVRHQYSVTYQWEGTEQPDGVELPEEAIYSPGVSVDVAEKPSVKGWSFDGWRIQSGLTESIDDGSFTMPNNNVVLVGSWAKKVHSYQVNANYFYVIDGDYSTPTQENTSEILLEHVNCENGNTTSYTLPADAFIYDDNTYTSVQLGSAASGVTISDNVINGIVPGSGTVPKIVVNLYRDIKRDYELNVKHVFKDNSTHEGYPSAYPDVGPKYQYDQSWDVSNLGAPEGYALVANESGIATSTTNDTLLQAGVLKGDTFGKADKYVILTYEKLPTYQVTYQYTGDAIEEPPTLPLDENTYYEGEKVRVKGDVSKEGYTFSGWTPETQGVIVTDGEFTMPAKDVVLVGSWAKKASYQVIVKYYTITDGEKTMDKTVDTQVQYCDSTAPVTVPYETIIGSFEYSAPNLVENTAGASLDETNHQVINITPATETAKVVVELTRTVTSSAEYKVVHEYYTVDPDLVETKTEQDVTETFTGSHLQTINAADVADHVIGKYERVSDSGSIVLDKDEPRTITITYKQYQYRVTIDGDEGVEIISGKTAADGGTVHDRGSDVAVSFSIKEGYLLTGLQVDEHELRDNSNVISFPEISANHRVVLTTTLRQKGTAAVHFVDEQGNSLQDPLVTDEMYIGDQFNVSQALEVEKIKLGNSEYTFDRHFQKRNMVRSTNGMMMMDDADYIGQMPAGGVEIVRVYKLDKVSCYYQLKKVFTGYDANGAVVYSATEEGEVTETGNLTETVSLPDTSAHGGYGFRLVSDAVMTADLTGSTKETPYVFVAYYEIRQGDEPVPGTQLPPGLTSPSDSSDDGASAGASAGGDLPPRTGDAGVAHWVVLMALAAVGLVMLVAHRKLKC